ncbi:MAG: penicillin-binding transpeptidase domain-containing protein [Oscillospiraceae bacterium]|nr:penicillin-binding transpeptidase domain-containing protein [Oscillospiraceae bacterium]
MARSDNNTSPASSMKKKLIFVFVLVVAMTVYIFTELFKTAVVNSEYYRSLANEQQLRDFTIPANRGTIFDRNGKILAQSKTVWTIVISPETIRKNSEVYQTQRANAAWRDYQKNRAEGLPALMPIDGMIYSEAEEICAALADIFGLDYDALLKRCTESELGFEIVARQAEKAEVDRLNEFKNEKGIGIFSVYAIEDTKRVYPNGTLAAAVIGFTNFDNIGVYGVEAYYDDYLQGVDGRFVMARDANNQAMPYDYEERFEAQNGNSLILTIDEVLQHYLEKNLEIAVSQHKPENRATGIIMNVNTGAVLAMATYPSFDLNEPSALSDEDYEKLDNLRAEKIADVLSDMGTEAALTAEQLEKIEGDISAQHSVMRETQWKNKALSELYFPGSVFKVITLAAALEEHAVDYNSNFYCGGVVLVGEERVHCWGAGHGQISGVTSAIAKSCNPAFMEIGRLLGSVKFSDYFDAFGFTRKTGVDLPGESGPIFIRRENMGAIDLAVSSFGQANKITPLQMITAYAAAVNGGHLVTPYVVDKIIDNDGNVVHSTQPQIKRQVISRETSLLMRRILEDVVEVNQSSNAYIAGYRIGGKSGTSQKLDEYKEGEPERYVGSFCAFTPADEPEIIMLVIVDDPRGGYYYGSMVAAPVVSEVFKEALPYLEIYKQQLSEEEQELQNVMIPYLRELSRDDAVIELEAAGLQYSFVGDTVGNRVLYTEPRDGQMVARNSRVVVYMAEQDYTVCVVPDIVGRKLNLADANEIITNAGLNIRPAGAIYNSDAVAFLQSIEPGTEVAAGTVIEVEFRFVDGYAG